MVYRTKYEYLHDAQELAKEIEKHRKAGSIFEEIRLDMPQIRLNFDRAENELKHAETMFRVSSNNTLKKELELLESDTFYSGVISHAYYAIFYATKAVLLKEKTRTKSPNVHRIYKSAIIKADSLLGLFLFEKDKRGEFTYQKLPDANKEPADESIKNAITFLTHVRKLTS